MSNSHHMNNSKGRHPGNFNRKSGNNNNVNHYNNNNNNNNINPLFNQDATLAYMKNYGYNMYNPQYTGYQNNYGYYPEAHAANTMGMYNQGYRGQPHGAMNKKHTVHASANPNDFTSPRSATSDVVKPSKQTDSTIAVTSAATSTAATPAVVGDSQATSASSSSATTKSATATAPSKNKVALSFMEQVAARRAAMLAKEPSTENKPEKNDSTEVTEASKPAVVKLKETPIKTEEVPNKTEQVPTKTEEAPVKTEEAISNILKAPLKTEETPVKIEKAPVKIEEAASEIEKAPAKVEEEASVSTQQIPAKVPEIASKIEESDSNVEKVPVEQGEEQAATAAESNEVPAKIEESSEKQLSDVISANENTSTLKEDIFVSQEETDENSEAPETEKTTDEFMLTISQFMSSVENSKPIEDPYNFTYTAPFNGPDQKVHESYKKTHKIKYDPRFLIQFREPISKFKYDDDWVAEYKKKISIPASSQLYSSNKNLGSRNQGGFGSFSKPSMSMRSQYNSKRGFTNDSGRSNSKQSSKRKGGSKRGDDSKRNNSKKYKELDSKATQVLDKIDGQLKNDQSASAAPPAAPLPKSANRWVPKTLRNAAAAAKGDAPAEIKKNSNGTDWLSQEDVSRKINSLLNKLALENFDTISKEIKDIAEQSVDEEDAITLETVLDLILAKACDEAHWSNIYAKLVAYLVRDIDPAVTTNKKDLFKDGVAPKGGVLARKLIIISCQKEYSKGWASQLDSSIDQYEMMSDEYYKAMAIKRRGLGLVKFIGELYSMKLINSNVIQRCLIDLSSNVTNPAEDQLETLAQLIITAGPIIDSDPNSELGKKNVFLLDRVFQNVETIIQLKSISSRIKFKFLDLIDNRKSKWVTKKDQGPKTIAEIHAEAEKEKEKEAKKLHKNQGNNYSKNSGSNWRKVSQNDMNSIGMVRNSSDKGVPTNNFKRNSARSNTSSSYRSGSNNDSRRSNTHTKEPKEEPAETSSSKNMYHLLGEQSEEEDDDEEEEEEERDEEEKQTDENVESDEKNTPDNANDEAKKSAKEQDSA